MLAGLRARLLALVLMALIPPVLLMVGTAVEQRRHSAEMVQQDALRVARLAAFRQSETLEQTRQLLSGLAHLPAIKNAQAAPCQQILGSLLQGYERYIGMGVVDENGSILCTAVDLPAGTTPGATGMRAVDRALASGEFVVGEFAIGKVSRRPIVWAVQPLRSDAGEPRRVVFASLSLDWLNRMAAEAQLPPGATLTALARDGTVLVRHPDPAGWVGQTLPDAGLMRHLREGADRTFTATGLDGERRLYAAVRVPGAALDSYIAVGVPTAVAFGPAERALQRNLAWLGIVGLLVLGLVWFSGDALILRRVRALLAATRRIEAGDLSARSGMGRGTGELEQLAFAFDRMAETLQQREQEAASAADVLRNSEASYRSLFDSITELVYIVDLQGRLLNVNAAAERQHGYAREEIIGRSPLLLVDTERVDAAAAEERFQRAAAGETVRVETWGRRNGEPAFPQDLVLSRAAYFGQDVVIGVGRDVTERRRATEALRASETRYRALFEQAPVGVFTYDLDLRVTSCNQPLAAIMKSDPDRLVGLELERLHDPCLLPALRAVLDGDSGSYEGPYQATPAGPGIWTSLRTAPSPTAQAGSSAAWRWSRTPRSAMNSRRSCCSRRRWRRSAASPAASPTTSTTCWPPSRATSSWPAWSCPKAAPRTRTWSTSDRRSTPRPR